MAGGVSLLVIAFFAYVVLSFRSQVAGAAISAREAFEALVANPVPNDVTELQGVAASSMQGYVAFLRFRSPAIVSAAMGPEYEPVGCQEVEHYFQLPPFVQSPFVPDWVPPTSAGRTCVRATGVANAWAKGAENRALFADGWVYFASSGD